ncbi:ADP-ribosylglycohydrolase family protein [Streptomyces sp. NPDC020875]|uniref:ADP-ribosylglycohydrolase family protein n=1 Tax=Streptomyces sp. NPDC020875 TaxID=3154898 RepID=UPI0033F034C3
MNSDQHNTGRPRFVPITTNLRIFEDDGSGMRITGGRPRYENRTDGAVQYVAVADTQNALVGYLWYNDADEAADWLPIKSGDSRASSHGGAWLDRLGAGKERGLTPSQTVTESLQQWPSAKYTHLVQGSLAQAPNLRTLYERAGRFNMDRNWKVSASSLFGLAIGDAMGYPTEFLNMEQIAATFGPWTEMGLPLSRGDVARVTDDTQMALAVGEALVEAAGPYREGHGPREAAAALTPYSVEVALRKHFGAWLRDPENNRAPGGTCLRACGNLERGMRWQDATVIGSKGCGANMRVTPVGLIPALGVEQRAGIAQLQAALTHGHPTALAASDLTSHATWLLAHRLPLKDLLAELRAYAQRNRTTYHGDWLGDLAAKADAPDPAAFIAFGWDETLRALDKAAEALRVKDFERDPCEAVGPGWIAEEALATALYCLLVVKYDGHPRTVVARAAHSSGDSDSIAALAGAFAGAKRGSSSWPPEWREAIEYKERISALAAVWDSVD